MPSGACADNLVLNVRGFRLSLAIGVDTLSLSLLPSKSPHFLPGLGSPHPSYWKERRVISGEAGPHTCPCAAQRLSPERRFAQPCGARGVHPSLAPDAARATPTCSSET